MVHVRSDAIRDKFAAVRRELGSALDDRDGEIDQALTALVANEHLLLVGPRATLRSCRR